MNNTEPNYTYGRSKKDTFKAVLPAMIVLIVINAIGSYICGEFQTGFNYNIGVNQLSMDIGSHIVYQLIIQVFAFITCWAFVLRKHKDDKHIWINYLIWALIFNLPKIAEQFHLA